MATAVASRFAVLSMDDDDDYPKKNQQKKKGDTKKLPVPNQSQSNNQKKKTKKNDSGKGSQQISTNKTKGKNGGAKGDGNKEQKKKGGASQDQWDQWKKKDVEFVDGSYETDLQQAILLSKLDYEEKKDVYDRLKKDAEEDKKPSGKKNKKSNKAQPMSLEQFNNLHTEGAVSDGGTVENATPSTPAEAPDPEFFERIKDEAKKAIDREQALEQRKAREPFIHEAITVAQLEDSLERRTKENEQLKEEIVKLKEELHNVKTRNKKLCNILAHGEMRDKAEVLMEVERLEQVREELTSEVSSLHAQLEQERSKSRAHTDSKSKSQKKRTASETTQ